MFQRRIDMGEDMENKKKTNVERIAEKKAQIEKIKERIKADTERIKGLEKEIETLENTEIKGAIKELNLPLEDVIKLLKDLKQ